MKRLLLAASLAALTLSAHALPSIDAVQAEIGKGHYAQAEDMMREVVAARPDSARAHYVYAEILAHDQRFGLAAEQAAQARRLDPSLSFTQPEKFKTFSQLIERGQAAAAPSRPVGHGDLPRLAAAPTVAPSGGVPGWAWGLGAGALALLALGAFGSRQSAARPWPSAVPGSSGTMAATSLGGPAGPAAGGYAPAYAPYAAPAAMPSGNGLLGTGLAVAGGVAAGMLAEKLIEGHRDAGFGPTFAPSAPGLEPGLFDDTPAGDAAARELEQRPIDMGSGDGWGADDVDPGLSSDGDGW